MRVSADVAASLGRAAGGSIGSAGSARSTTSAGRADPAAAVPGPS